MIFIDKVLRLNSLKNVHAEIQVLARYFSAEANNSYVSVLECCSLGGS